jgi:hypothetical protein
MKTIQFNWKNKLTIILFTFLSVSLNGQSISQKLGGIITNFTIKSESILLNNEKQILIKRGVSSYGIDYEPAQNFSYGYAYGYGYQSYHIEFVSENRIQEKKGKNKKIYPYYECSLIDASGNKIQKAFIPEGDIKLWLGKKENNDFYTYSINLINIPIVSLDDISEINIVKIIPK